MVISIGGEAETAYKITDIAFLKGKFVLSLKEHGKVDELLKLEGALFGENIIILSELDNDSKKSKELLFFLRESIVPELKEKARKKIKEIQSQDT